MIRLIGVFLLIGSCIGIGLWTGKKEQMRMQQLVELIRSMDYLKGEISFARTTLPEAMEHLSGRLLFPFDQLFLGLGQDLKKYPGSGFGEIFRQAIEREKGKWELLPEDVENFYQACCNLGYLDKEMQIHILERYSKELEKNVEQLREEMPKKMKLYRNLGVLGGIFFVIILI